MFKKYRSVIVFMIFLSTIINYIDRSALSIVAPIITKEFKFSASQMGMIFSMFFVGYTVFNFVGGYLSDYVGPRKVMIVAMTFWSITCGLTALTWSFASLMIVRTLFGIGEGPLSSSTNKLFNNWFPKKERAGAMGMGTAGGPLGGAIASPIIGFLAIKFSWRVSFIAVVIIGLIWVLVWSKLSTDYPRQNSRVSKEEIDEIEKNQELDLDISKKDVLDDKPLRYYIKQPIILFTAFGFFSYNYILYFFLTWFPSYLTMERHLSIKSMSIANIIPWVIGCLGAIYGGKLTDYVYKKTNNALFSRKLVIIVGMVGSAITIAFTGFAKTAVGSVALMSVGICFLYIVGPSFWGIIHDNVSGKHVGGTGGFVHALSNISGIIAPTVTGFIVQISGNFTSAFLLVGVLAIISSVLLGFFAKPIKNSNSGQLAMK